MAAPWLSILIPVYNVEDFLQECLTSITSQMPKGVEIIALNDCSTDKSSQVLNDICLSSPVPIKIMQHEQNCGLSAARNTMLDTATGEYIWFLDSDDALHENAITELYDIVTKYQPDFVMCDFRVWRERATLKHRLRGENHKRTFRGLANTLLSDPEKLFEGVYLARNLHIWSKISRRSLWGDDLRFPEGRVMEDMVITPRLMLRAKKYYYIPKVWVAYRQRAGSILSTLNLKKIDDMSTASEGVMAAWLEKYPLLSANTRFAFCYLCIKTHIVITRDLKKLQDNIDIAVYRDRLFSHMQTTKLELFLQYIKRGWVIRFIRLLREF